jgi:hypothetical protein
VVLPEKKPDATNGFPIWIDIYGEEPCVAIESYG